MIWVLAALANPCEALLADAHTMDDATDLDTLRHALDATADCPVASATVHALLGRVVPDPEEGLTHLDACIEGFADARRARDEAHCWLDRGRLLGPGGDAEVAFAKAEALGADSDRLSWARGESAWASNARAEALTHFERAIANAKGGRATPWLYELAVRLRSGPEVSEDGLYSALAIADRVHTPAAEAPSLESVRDAMAPNEGVVVILLAPETPGRTLPSLVGLITPKRVSVEMIDARAIRAASASHLEAVQSDSEWMAPGAGLFQLLFEKLPTLPEQVSILPGEALQPVPFAALVSGDGPLGASRGIVVDDTLSSWLAARSHTPTSLRVQLWPTTDTLLQTAYDDALAGGASHAEAMQHARHTAIDARIPVSEWAGHRLRGDGIARPFPPRTPWGLWALGLAGVAIVIAGGVLWTRRR